jgi:rhodanese-related sulfurtransferase
MFGRSNDNQTVREIDVLDAYRRMSDDRAVLIDVREEDELRPRWFPERYTFR